MRRFWATSYLVFVVTCRRIGIVELSTGMDDLDGPVAALLS